MTKVPRANFARDTSQGGVRPLSSCLASSAETHSASLSHFHLSALSSGLKKPRGRLVRMKWIAVLFFLLPCFAFAHDWEALHEPGAIAIMRHAIAPGTGDPPQFELGDCSTQRNLDERGREQAREIGAAFRSRGITFDQVLTSQWCRTRETASLLNLGPVVDAPALNSSFRDYTAREHRTQDTRELIEELDGRLLLVTHQVNISALTGRSTRSGEVLVIRSYKGAFDLLGSIFIDP